MSWRVESVEVQQSWARPEYRFNTHSGFAEAFLADQRQAKAVAQFHISNLPCAPHPNQFRSGMTLEEFFVKIYLPTLPAERIKDVLAAIVARRLGAASQP